MGSGTSGKPDYHKKPGGEYVRFGDIPQGGRSVNFLSMNFRQSEAFHDEIANGATQEEALARAVGAENAERYLENGVSVFRMDKDGLPEIENLQQASSLAARIGAPIYSVSGTSTGTGRDGEPLVNVKNAKRVNIDTQALVGKIERVLRANYEQVIIDRPSGDISQVYEFRYWKWDGNRYPDGTRYILYNGKEYTKPKKGWDDRLG